jgi:hypothetical protein
MKIIDKIAAAERADEPYFSLEFFPPKTEAVQSSGGGELISGVGKPSISIESYGTIQASFYHRYLGRRREHCFKIT